MINLSYVALSLGHQVIKAHCGFFGMQKETDHYAGHVQRQSVSNNPMRSGASGAILRCSDLGKCPKGPLQDVQRPEGVLQGIRAPPASSPYPTLSDIRDVPPGDEPCILGI